MSDNLHANTSPARQTIYQIRFRGQVGPQWTKWFEGMAIASEDNGETTVTGPVVDQAALHGLLKKVRDLGLPLLSVTRLQPDQSDSRDVET